MNLYDTFSFETNEGLFIFVFLYEENEEVEVFNINTQEIEILDLSFVESCKPSNFFLSSKIKTHIYELQTLSF